MVYRVGNLRYPQTNLCTSRYCVAYLDILGTKNLICEDEDYKFLNYLNMLIEDVFTEASFSKKVFVKIFSDNILFAIKLKKEDEKTKIEKLINIIANVQNEMLRYGYLTRGSIALGEFFHNDMIIYGKALVDAVEMEEKDAIYPRVIVQKEIYELLLQYFLKDEDGLFFLNNFLFSKAFEHISFKLKLLEMLKKCQNEKVRQKLCGQ